MEKKIKLDHKQRWQKVTKNRINKIESRKTSEKNEIKANYFKISIKLDKSLARKSGKYKKERKHKLPISVTKEETSQQIIQII